MPFRRTESVADTPSWSLWWAALSGRLSELAGWLDWTGWLAGLGCLAGLRLAGLTGGAWACRDGWLAGWLAGWLCWLAGLADWLGWLAWLACFFGRTEGVASVRMCGLVPGAGSPITRKHSCMMGAERRWPKNKIKQHTFEVDRLLQSQCWCLNFCVGVHGPHVGVTWALGQTG